MYALSEHTILDTLEGYRSSGIHKERSNFFYGGLSHSRDLFFHPSIHHFLTFCWRRIRTQLCGSHLSEDGWIGRLGSGRCGN